MASRPPTCLLLALIMDPIAGQMLMERILCSRAGKGKVNWTEKVPHVGMKVLATHVCVSMCLCVKVGGMETANPHVDNFSRHCMLRRDANTQRGWSIGWGRVVRAAPPRGGIQTEGQQVQGLRGGLEGRREGHGSWWSEREEVEGRRRHTRAQILSWL